MILALLYSIGFALAGVPWWPVLGLVCGFLQLLPVGGALIALALSAGTAWFATENMYVVTGALVTFVAVQALEGFYLTPRIVGSRVGLRPWVIFLAVLFGGFIFGPIGVILAVPVAAVAAIALRRMQSRVEERPFAASKFR